MHVAGDNLILAATDLSGFAACTHLTTLERAAALGVGPKPPKFPDPAADVLRRRGHEHETRLLEGYRAAGLSVVEIADPYVAQDGDATHLAAARLARWQTRAARTLEAMRAGADIIYQGCFFDSYWLGLPDFLARVERPSALGAWSYEVVDAKLAREAKAGAVLQITMYSELLGRAQGAEPEHMHLALGGMDGGRESFRYHDFAAYYRSVRGRMLGAVGLNGSAALGEPVATYPEPVEHCDVCAWQYNCRKRWIEDDHLSLVAGITRRQREELTGQGVETLAALGRLPLPVHPPLESVSPAALERVREQARIQLEGREAGAPRYELFTGVEPGYGLSRLPEPSPGDIFFDIEGDPHALDDGLEYLFGTCDAQGTFTGAWALDRAEEKAMFERFIDGVMARLERHPDLHVYHFGHYESTALKRLMGRHATREEEVDRLLRGAVLVDLHRVVTQSMRASVESYSIKKLEPLFGFERAVDLRAASSALAHFEAWLALGTSERETSDLLREIEGYNRDDCISTARLRDWLEERRLELARLTSADVPRPVAPEAKPSQALQEEIDRVQAVVDALTDGIPADLAQQLPDEHARWMLAHLLSWHRREKKSMWWEYFRLRDMDEAELLNENQAISSLTYERDVGTVKSSTVHRYRFPAQDFGLRRGGTPRDPRTEKGAGQIVAIDDDAGTIDLKRGNSSKAPHPSAIIAFDTVPDGVLRESLLRLGTAVAERGLEECGNRAAADLLLRRPPRVGQAEGADLRAPGETSLEAARRLASCLDRTVLPIQGPPGTGKTHVGARMVVSLMRAGKRVGVTATSHKVIVNLLDKICEAADEEGLRFQGIQKSDEDGGCAHAYIECKDDNSQVHAALDSGEARLAAGTVWLWSRPEMAGMVDVLVVDEAGQISLANVLAASQSAGSIVLLGDPRQLEQPQKGVHPPGTGVAALEHLVGGDTLPPDRGLFLEQTWRLHPDVCAFTSELYYQGRLTSRPELAHQTVIGPEPFKGSGPRFWPVEHEGNTSESAEEVEVVAALVERLLGAEATWMDTAGVKKPIRAADILVVAPYNAQVAALRSSLRSGVAVGTVDRFQGQEAPVVIYSTASSTAQDAPRGMSFLFSPNRLNVATSRARCVVVWVGSPALLGADCRSVEQMRWANGICRFGERTGQA